MSKGRLEQLRALEEKMPSSFSYFTTTYRESRKHCEAVSWLPVVGERMRLLPHLYRDRTFLRSLALQQGFLLLWFVVGVFVVVKAVGN